MPGAGGDFGGMGGMGLLQPEPVRMGLARGSGCHADKCGYRLSQTTSSSPRPPSHQACPSTEAKLPRTTPNCQQTALSACLSPAHLVYLPAPSLLSSRRAITLQHPTPTRPASLLKPLADFTFQLQLPTYPQQLGFPPCRNRPATSPRRRATWTSILSRRFPWRLVHAPRPTPTLPTCLKFLELRKATMADHAELY